MKVGFSTLGCPDWPLPKILIEAKRFGFQGVELRYVAGTDTLWDVPELTASQLSTTKRAFADLGLTCTDVGARAHFHFTDATKRKEMIEEAKRNVDIAAGLGSPGVRLWGDKVQKGGERVSTMKWISEAVWAIADYGRPAGVEAWLESHGDFTASADVVSILKDCGCHGAGATWDPANAMVAGEDPVKGAAILGPYIKHVHFKDEKIPELNKRQVTLMGEGDVPLGKIVDALAGMNYKGFLSYEWEKRNFPAIPGPEEAFPQFIEWWKAHGR